MKKYGIGGGILIALTCLFAAPVWPADSAPKLKRPPFAAGGAEPENIVLLRLRSAIESRGTYSTSDIRAFLSEAAGQRSKWHGRYRDDDTQDDVPEWKSIGPTSANFLQNSLTLPKVDSGRLRTILVDPNHRDRVYALSSGGGLWRTDKFSDPNNKWEALSDSVGSTSGGSFAFGGDADTLYLGTGDPFDPAAGGFMVASSNGGRKWSSPFVLNGVASVLDVKVDTSNGKDIVLVGTNNGLFRSTDAGKTYSAVPTLSFGGNQVWSIVRTGAGWLASSQADRGGIPSYGTTTLYLSVNQGATWTPTGTGFAQNATRTTLAVGADGDTVVYAIAADGNFYQLDLFRSTDGGLNWLALGLPGKLPGNPNPDQTDMDVLKGQAWYNQMLLVDPADASRNTVYLGGNLSSVKSIDGGATWTVLTNWLAQFGLPYVHADFHCGAFDQSGRLFFGGDGGVFYSDDKGVTWNDKRNTGLVDHLIFAVTASAVHPDESLVGLQDNGTRYRLPGTTIYNQVLGGDGFGVGWTQANDNFSVASLYFNSLYRVPNNPPDDQSKWLYSSNDIFDYQFNFFTPLTPPSALSDPVGRAFYTYTPTFVYVSVNGTANWSVLGNINELAGNGPENIDGGPPGGMFFRDVVHGLGVAPDLKHVGVSATGGRVALTGDGGATWKTVRLNTAVPGFASFTSNVTWSTNSTVFVSSINSTAAAVHVVKSTDGGTTWTRSDSGLPAVGVHRLLADPRDTSGRTLYAATLLGVYNSSDGGASWQLLGRDLPQVAVTDLYLSPSSNTLKISTYGRGVWQLRLNESRDN